MKLVTDFRLIKASSINFDPKTCLADPFSLELNTYFMGMTYPDPWQVKKNTGKKLTQKFYLKKDYIMSKIGEEIQTCNTK